MHVGDVERLVEGQYKAHGLNVMDPLGPWAFARRVLGPRAIEAHASLVGGSHAYQLRGQWRIAISKRLPVEYAGHAVLHELGHATFAMHGIRFDSAREEEAAADLYGAVAMAPGVAVRAFHRHHGLRIKALAKHAVSTPTWAALRFAEALTLVAIVVSPAQVRVRGPEGFDWPPPAELRTIAKTHPRGTRQALGRERLAYFPAA